MQSWKVKVYKIVARPIMLHDWDVGTDKMIWGKTKKNTCLSSGFTQWTLLQISTSNTSHWLMTVERKSGKAEIIWTCRAGIMEMMLGLFMPVKRIKKCSLEIVMDAVKEGAQRLGVKVYGSIPSAEWTANGRKRWVTV